MSLALRTLERIAALVVAAVLAATITGWRPAPPPEEASARMAVGERRALAVPAGARVSVAPSGICALMRLDERLFVLVGLAAGDARLVFHGWPGHTGERLHVEPAAPEPPEAAPADAWFAHMPVPEPTPSPAASPSAAPSPVPEAPERPAPPRLLGIVGSPRGGVALFPGREAHRGEHVGDWEVCEVLEDAVRLRTGARIVLVPISGRPKEETEP